MKNLILILVGVLFLASCSTAPKEKTIYIVRHGEKVLTGDDPMLSEVGQLRSQKLAQILSDKGIEHVFSTNYRRTRDTALPTSMQAGVETQIYDPRNHDELVEQLNSLDGNILVVGHSNTVGQIANYFVGEGEKYGDLSDDEYNFIYIVDINKDGSKVTRKTFRDY
ncbi:SixA phosphatase family protein [Algoriphagus machipongonensis]|uniref:Phosphoglycerate mutase family protein n=1 Tax=Algoriphagus machipongonensis TaxID=388413 RepID=A3HXQ4_9BACT|nr:phosphoglycerate mutase family protein [Algoriphagus machipongonensis]EAZ81377.1 phosphoglycerate mutase family protein [Algoriphagus machipongonensis]